MNKPFKPTNVWLGYIAEDGKIVKVEWPKKITLTINDLIPASSVTRLARRWIQTRRRMYDRRN